MTNDEMIADFLADENNSNAGKDFLRAALKRDLCTAIDEADRITSILAAREAAAKIRRMPPLPEVEIKDSGVGYAGHRSVL